MQTLPKYVKAALSADRTAQLTTIASITVYVFGELRAAREVKELAKRLHEAGDHRSEQTWANYATACGKAATSLRIAPKLTAFFDEVGAKDATITVADIAPAFATWLQAELKKGGFTTSVDDVAGYATNKKPLSVQRKEKEEEETKAKAERDAQALAAAAGVVQGPAPDAPTEPANNPGDIPNTGTEAPQAATGYDQAVFEPIETLMVVTRKEGEVTYDLKSQNLDDIQAMIDFLQGQMDALLAEPAEAQEAETV